MITRLVQRKRPRRSALLTIGGGGLVAGALLAAAAFAFTDSGTVDVQVNDRTGAQVNHPTNAGAFISYFGDSNTTFGSSGTGTFNPFYRIGGSPSEQGYNTVSQPGPKNISEFDTKPGTWTHPIKVSDIPQRSCPDAANNLGAGNPPPPPLLNSETCFELFVDINETTSTATTRISLNKVQVYFTTLAGGAITGYPNGGFTDPATSKQYDFSGSILINDVNQGSGRGDLRYDIPINGPNPIDVASINCDYGNPLCNTWFVLYSQWGAASTADTYASDGGYEEWKVKVYPVVHILKTANPVGPVNAGTPIGFDVTVSNTSAIAATNVVISDNLPAGAGNDLVWALNPAFPGCSIAGTSAPQTLNCTFATLAANSSIGPIHITSPTTKADCAVVQNTASFTTGNDGSGSSTASVTVQCGALRILKETTKVDTAGNHPLVKTTGATFTITGPGGYSQTVVDNGTGSIDEETGTAGIGVVCISGLAPSTTAYTVTETVPPTGYGLPSTTTRSATVASGTNCTSNKPTTANSAVFTDPPLYDLQVNFKDDGSGETSATISCSPLQPPNSTAPPSPYTTSSTYTNRSAPQTVTCTITVHP